MVNWINKILKAGEKIKRIIKNVIKQGIIPA